MKNENLKPSAQSFTTRFVVQWIGLPLLIILGLSLTSLYNYLLFHSLAEVFSIVIACGIFMVTWNARRFIESNYLLFLGIAYLMVGSVDLMHTLAYKGMGIFEGYDADLPTQLWIAARYLESLSLLLAPLFIHRRVNLRALFLVYATALTLLFFSLFSWNIFPACFIEGAGLTPFKKVSEYIICAILLGALTLLVKNREVFDRGVLRLLILSIIFTIGAELAFTFYISVYGLSNFLGHIFKIASFYLIYRALIVTGLEKPYNLLFRELKESEDSLRKALADVKTLRGLLPVCSWCKKIRDYEGYWDQIESYVEKHSYATFSHGICPECAEKVQGEFNNPAEEE